MAQRYQHAVTERGAPEDGADAPARTWLEGHGVMSIASLLNRQRAVTLTLPPKSPEPARARSGVAPGGESRRRCPGTCITGPAPGSSSGTHSATLRHGRTRGGITDDRPVSYPLRRADCASGTPSPA